MNSRILWMQPIKEVGFLGWKLRLKALKAMGGLMGTTTDPNTKVATYYECFALMGGGVKKAG